MVINYDVNCQIANIIIASAVKIITINFSNTSIDIIITIVALYQLWIIVLEILSSQEAP